MFQNCSSESGSTHLWSFAPDFLEIICNPNPPYSHRSGMTIASQFPLCSDTLSPSAAPRRVTLPRLDRCDKSRLPSSQRRRARSAGCSRRDCQAPPRRRRACWVRACRFCRRAEQLRVRRGSRLQRVDGLHAQVRHLVKFLGVASVLVDGRVGAQANLEALGERLWNVSRNAVIAMCALHRIAGGM